MWPLRIPVAACLAGLTLAAIPFTSPTVQPAPHAIRIRIAAATVPPPSVTVTATPRGIWVDSTDTGVRSQLTMRTPVVIDVSDSVQSLRIAVQGSGAVAVSSIRRPDAVGHGGTTPLAPIGRDITLRRDSNGRFSPVVTVHPAGP